MTNFELNKYYRTTLFNGLYRCSGEYGQVYNIKGNIFRHNGIDFATPIGVEIRAFDDGLIYDIDGDNGGLNLFGQNFQRFGWYFHLSVIFKKVGDRVKKGDIIGLSGATSGMFTIGPHIHFNIGKTRYQPYKDFSKVENPYNYINSKKKKMIPLKENYIIFRDNNQLPLWNIRRLIKNMRPSKKNYEKFQAQLPLLESNNYQDVLRGVDNVGRIFNGKEVDNYPSK